MAGWRFDISGLAPEMRGDYEAHLAECAHCRSRQVLHRTIDIGLMIIAGISAVMFWWPLAQCVTSLRAPCPRIDCPCRVSLLQRSLADCRCSHPAPVVVADVARIQARRLHDRLPSQIREKLPEITQEFLKER